MAKKDNKRLNFKDGKARKIVRKEIIVLLIIFGVLIAVFFSLKAFVSNLADLEFFRLQYCYIEGEGVELGGQQAFNYCRLSKAENLLEVDLEALRDRVLNLHPHLKQALVEKKYPDTIRVFIEDRKAFAQIQARRFFLVDEEGFILNESFENPLLDLPMIIGINSHYVKEGVFAKSLALERAIEIIKLLDSRGFRDKYELKEIDVSNPHNISFYINEDVEIKLGKDDFMQKIKKIESRLPNLDLKQIRYVDLRFKDLIVGPK